MKPLRQILLPLFCLFALPFAALAQQGTPQPAVGDAIAWPETTLLDGRKLAAQDVRGKVMLVDFWATWCPICRRELPHMQKLHEQYRDKGLVLVALSLDADQFVVEEFLKDHDHNLPVAMRTAAHSKVFGLINVTPTLYLIDRQGKVRLVHRGAMAHDRLAREIEAALRN